jgi:hypothetical protein
MGRTTPSSRTTLTMEKEVWKPFRNALDKSDRKEFDEMWDIPRLYASACSNSVQLVPLHPIIMSILFHHYKELKECTEVEQIQEASRVTNNGSKKKEWLTIKEEEAEEQEEKQETCAATLDSYLIHSNTIYK